MEYLWFFLLYAFIGWCVEVAFHVVTTGQFINRGFLNGPACPIYGFGMILLIGLLSPLSQNFILLFLASFLLTSALEYVTGYILEKVFHNKWWDYTDRPFHIRGYICLSFSIAWGLSAVFVINIVHPAIFKLVSLLNNKFGNIILSLLLAILITDFIITVMGIMKIKKRILLLDNIREELRIYSDELGNKIYKGMTAAIKTKEKMNHKFEDSTYDFKSNLGEKKVHIQNLKAKYKKVLKEKGLVHKRLEKAFPGLKKKFSDYGKKEE